MKVFSCLKPNNINNLKVSPRLAARDISPGDSQGGGRSLPLSRRPRGFPAQAINKTNKNTPSACGGDFYFQLRNLNVFHGF